MGELLADLEADDDLRAQLEASARTGGASPASSRRSASRVLGLGNRPDMREQVSPTSRSARCRSEPDRSSSLAVQTGQTRKCLV
jgi:hypothetical protein